MPRFEEILWDRVAQVSRKTMRKYAVLTRGAWGERTIRPISNENNTHQFTGRIFDPLTGVQGEEHVIGFYHPLFTGYIGKHGVVEVVDSQVQELDIRYIARGRGALSISAMASCLGELVQDHPCHWDCPSETYVWGGNPNTTELGTPESTAIYDFDTMTHDMGPNEVPAYLSLPGYSGTPARPAIDRPLWLTWSPNLSAFQPAFQLCGQPPCSGGGDTDLRAHECCDLVRSWEDQYGPDWCAVIKQMIEDGEIIPSVVFDGGCSWVFEWVLANC